MLIQELMEMNNSTDEWVFSIGVDEGSPRRTKGDAAKVCKKMLSDFKKAMKMAGEDDDPKYIDGLPKWSAMTDPAELYTALLSADLAWDGYDIELTKNGEEIPKPPGVRY